MEKRTKENQQAICSICDQAILEGDDDADGEDAIFCEGDCKGWLHRKCIGMTKLFYDKLSNSNDPYVCHNCIIIKQSQEIAALKAQNHEIQQLKKTIKILTDELSALKNKPQLLASNAAAVTSASVCTNKHNTIPVDKTNASTGQIPKVTKTSPNYSSERKFNIVLYGVEESPLNTPRSERTQADLSRILQVLHNLDENTQASSIKDHYRLGKYNNAKRQKPRPILLKFLRSSDVLNILLKKADLPSPFSIKPDMSPEEQQIENMLLKERWQLIQNGTDRKLIKIRRNNLYLNDKLYASVSDAKLHLASSSPRVIDTSKHLTHQRPAQNTNVLPNSACTSEPMLISATDSTPDPAPSSNDPQ